MPKYGRKQNLSVGSFPVVAEKQKMYRMFHNKCTKVALYYWGCIRLRNVWYIKFFHWQWDILVQTACVRRSWWQMQAKLAIVFTYFFSPGVLACATRGGGWSEAGHCFHLLFSSSFFSSSSSTPSAFHPLRETPMTENLFPPITRRNIYIKKIR